jgi:uncharacterized membrane protein YphA (DoxX/SURF4 family)
MLESLPRWFLGVVLIATGTGKAFDMPGFVHVLAAYDLLPSSGNVALAYTLPFLELATGICLLTGTQILTAAGTAVGLHVVLLSAVLVTLWRGMEIANCGCFGVFLARPLTGQTVAEDAAMLSLSLLVFWQVRRNA